MSKCSLKSVRLATPHTPTTHTDLSSIDTSATNHKGWCMLHRAKSTSCNMTRRIVAVQTTRFKTLRFEADSEDAKVFTFTRQACTQWGLQHDLCEVRYGQQILNEHSSISALICQNYAVVTITVMELTHHSSDSESGSSSELGKKVAYNPVVRNYSTRSTTQK